MIKDIAHIALNPLDMDKNWQAWIHDPDGNKVELMMIDPESPQAKA